MAGLLMLELAIRVLWFSGGLVPLSFDAASYWRLAGEIVAGDLWLVESKESLRPPLFLWWLAGFRALFGASALAALSFTQSALGLATSMLAARLAVLVSGLPSAAPAALAALLLAPGRIPFDGMAMSESLFSLLLLAHAVAAVSFLCGPTPARAAIAGVLLGAATLTRSTPQYLWFLFAAIALGGGLARSAERRQAARYVLVFGAALAGVLAPWVARNVLVLGDLSVTRGVGVRLWAAAFSNRAAALELPTEELRTQLSGVDFRHEWQVYERARGIGLEEVDRDRWMVSASLQAIRAAPDAYLASAARNWVKHFASSEEAFPWYDRRSLVRLEGDAGQWIPGSGTVYELVSPIFKNYFVYPPAWLLASGLAALVAGVAAAGLSPVRSAGLWLLGALLYFPSITAFGMYPLYRFRAPTEALLAAAIGAGATVVWRRLRVAEADRRDSI